MGGAVKLAVPLAGTLTSKAPRGSDVTVWFWASAFLTVTFAPAVTDAGIVYLKSLMVIRPGSAIDALALVAAADGVDGDGMDGDDAAVLEAPAPVVVVDAPHPVSPTISPAAAMANSPGLMLMMCLSWIRVPVGD